MDSWALGQGGTKLWGVGVVGYWQQEAFDSVTGVTCGAGEGMGAGDVKALREA